MKHGKKIECPADASGPIKALYGVLNATPAGRASKSFNDCSCPHDADYRNDGMAGKLHGATAAYIDSQYRSTPANTQCPVHGGRQA